MLARHFRYSVIKPRTGPVEDAPLHVITAEIVVNVDVARHASELRRKLIVAVRLFHKVLVISGGGTFALDGQLPLIVEGSRLLKSALEQIRWKGTR